MSMELRWGIPELDNPIGMTPIPNFVLEYAASFGVTPQEMTMIVHLASFKYESSKSQGSKPAVDTIAKLMGYTDDKQVRRMIARLEKALLLKVIRTKGETSIYDFSALTQKCWQSYLTGGLPSKGVSPFKGEGVSPSKGSEEEELKEEKTNTLPVGKKGRLNVPFVTALATDSPMPDVVEPEKKATHPLRKRGKNGTSNPYTCAVAYFWSGRPYSEWSQADKQGEGFRFNKLFETGGALELLYEEIGGFTPEQLADALKAWCIQNPDTPPKSRPREQKLYSHIAPLLRQIVTTASQKIVSIENTSSTDWREHARLAQLRKENGK